jgi:hypothetical protein
LMPTWTNVLRTLAPSVPYEAKAEFPQIRMGRAGLEPATLGLNEAS